MDNERDKFLTEAMGEEWSDDEDGYGIQTRDDKCYIYRNNDFSTWPGFGKLWEWAQKQEWFSQFMMNDAWKHWQDHRSPKIIQQTYFNRIHPDRFADALYKFLKEKNL